MKISQVSEEYLLSLTPEQKWEIVCGGVADDGYLLAGEEVNHSAFPYVPAAKEADARL